MFGKDKKEKSKIKKQNEENEKKLLNALQAEEKERRSKYFAAREKADKLYAAFMAGKVTSKEFAKAEQEKEKCRESYLKLLEGYSVDEVNQIKRQGQLVKQPSEPKKADKPSGTILSPKVAKADELRRAALKASDKATRITKKSNEELQNAKTPEEKAAVRKKYAEKRKQAKFDSGKAFREYDDYLQKEFGIDNAYMETNEAYTGTEKGFINWLQAKFSKKKKK